MRDGDLVSNTLIHFPPWRTDAEGGRYTGKKYFVPRASGWRIRLPPGQYRVWLVAGDRSFTSPAEVYVNGLRAFTRKQEAIQMGLRCTELTVPVTPLRDNDQQGELLVSPIPYTLPPMPQAPWSCHGCGAWNGTIWPSDWYLAWQLQQDVQVS